MIQEMKNNALAKAKSRKGFTLAELLIVVAIIAILIAIAIPLFTKQLDSAKKATDEANFRTAKAVAMGLEVDLIEGGAAETAALAKDGYTFDAKAGDFTGTAANAYKSQSATSSAGATGKVITVDVTGKKATVAWATP